MIESRDGPEGMSPAYYLAADWPITAGLLPRGRVGLGYPFDASWWRAVRAEHRGRDPLVTLAREETGASTPCPRCHGHLRTDLDQVFERGWAPAVHAMPIGDPCGLRGHAVLDPRRLPEPSCIADDEQFAGVEGRTDASRLWRLADRVPEPDDHGH